ncbi:hypothetical protein MKW98_020165 [Papaver atlanticum]|uniref:Uncharacterized protein n=1 Tax=Papaver atlanticum TaxID=357466 RepID=A0AAD4S975_9MAGN|nr:hypothetical protein MKW98_020165 [Papaver atlanticum]
MNQLMFPQIQAWSWLPFARLYVKYYQGGIQLESNIATMANKPLPAPLVEIATRYWESSEILAAEGNKKES